MTSQYFHTIPTSCAICLVFVICVHRRAMCSACWCAWRSHVVDDCNLIATEHGRCDLSGMQKPWSAWAVQSLWHVVVSVMLWTFVAAALVTHAQLCGVLQFHVQHPYQHVYLIILLEAYTHPLSMFSVSKCQLSVPLPEGKRAIKRQLYSGPFTLREAASFIFGY